MKARMAATMAAAILAFGTGCASLDLSNTAQIERVGRTAALLALAAYDDDSDVVRALTTLVRVSRTFAGAEITDVASLERAVKEQIRVASDAGPVAMALTETVFGLFANEIPYERSKRLIDAYLAFVGGVEYTTESFASARVSATAARRQ